MRYTKYINNDWLYKPDFKEEYINTTFDGKGFEKVELPHTNIEIPYNCFDEKIYQFTSCYRRKLSLTNWYKNKKIFIDFEGIMIYAKVYLNGNCISEHKGGYTPFSVDITNYVNFNEENILVVMVDSTERKDIPPYGYVVDYLTYGGIYREVKLRIVDKLFIENVQVKVKDTLSNNIYTEIDVYLENTFDIGKYCEIKASIIDGGNTIDSKVNKFAIKAKEKTKVTIFMDNFKNIELWDLDNPKLYSCHIEISDNKKVKDSFETKFGFRQAIFKEDGFYLNKIKTKLIGLNRHQSYPYVGYAMPERVQKKDAEILKYDLGLNVVRTSHYPQSRHFLDRCDEIGLLVFEEIPGWQHIGNNEWKTVALNNVKDMIYRDWNRPSVILWGVRINESQDDHDFYKATNEIACKMDETRQTAGVRYLPKSELLEDVFTLNDFTHNGGKKVLMSAKKAVGNNKTPYLVTEYNGHMYPTKRFDQEERLVEHSLRHIRVINKQLWNSRISGGIGWCAFDYNTHKEFGSGDKICYHGVMDMFRIPKYAASVYASQSDHKLVMDIISLGSIGEKDESKALPLHILTNCDYVVLYKNNIEIDKYYPDKKIYKNLYHPPIVIKHIINPDIENEPVRKKDVKVLKETIKEIMSNGKEGLSLKLRIQVLWVMFRNKIKIQNMIEILSKYVAGWGTEETYYTFVGYKNDEEVIRKTIGGNVYASKLLLRADDNILVTSLSSYDATRIVVKLLDNRGNILPFINEFIEFEVSGPVKIIGPKKVGLIGGTIATWIKTTGEKGDVKIKAKCSRFNSNEINIVVK